MTKEDSKDKDTAPRENASASSIEDDKLVKEALSGRESSYKKLTEKYQRALFFHIRKMIRQEEMTEDLVQEVFIKAFNNLDSYSNKYAFSTWLYRIATNHTIDFLRKKRLSTYSINDPVKTKDGEMQIQLPDTDFATDEPLIKKQRKQIVHDAIDDLPEKYRRVIELRHMEEYSYDEISEELDLPLGTVKAHIFRARELLYKALKDKKDRF